MTRDAHIHTNLAPRTTSIQHSAHTACIPVPFALCIFAIAIPGWRPVVISHFRKSLVSVFKLRASVLNIRIPPCASLVTLWFRLKGHRRSFPIVSSPRLPCLNPSPYGSTHTPVLLSLALRPEQPVLRATLLPVHPRYPSATDVGGSVRVLCCFMHTSCWRRSLGSISLSLSIFLAFFPSSILSPFPFPFPFPLAISSTGSRIYSNSSFLAMPAC